MKQILPIVSFVILLPVGLAAQEFGLQWLDQLSGNASNNIENINLAIDNSGNIYAAFTFTGTVDFDPSSSVISATAAGKDIYVAQYTKDGVLTSNRFHLSNAGDQLVNDIGIDSQGNVYITGTASGLVNYSPSGITANQANVGTTGTDIFIAKYTETGQYVWVKTYGSSTDAEGQSLTIDENDNLYLAGKFRGTMSIFASGSSSNLVAHSSLSDIFIGRFQSSGTMDWGFGFGDTGEDEATDVVYDAVSKRILITGSFQGSVDFDSGPGEKIISSTVFADNTYVATFTPSGIIQWAIPLAGGSSQGLGITTDLNSNVYVTGYFQTSSPGADFDPSPSSSALVIAEGTPDSYIAKYDMDGNYVWAKSMAVGFGVGGGVSVTSTNKLIATGVFSGDIEFGTGQTVKNALMVSSYLARFDEDGTLLSSAVLGETNNLEHVMKAGNLLIGGRLRGTGQFDAIHNDDEITSSGNYDTYFALYDATGPRLTKNNTSDVATLGTDLTVNIELEDPETGVKSVAIDYRAVSSNPDANFSRVTLTNKSGNTYEGTIPSDGFGELGIEFQMVATNTVDVVATSQLLTTNLSVPEGLTIPQKGSGNGDQSDYRIISVPLNLQSKTVAAVFEDDLGKYNPKEYRLFSYENGTTTTELNSNSSIEIGKGYWMIIAGNERTIGTGAGKTPAVNRSDLFTIDLVQGWNLIGNPYYFNVLWTDVRDLNTGLGTLKVYDGTFKDGLQLDKMGGGFVFAESATTIQIPTTKRANINGRKSQVNEIAQRKPLHSGEWELALNLSQANSAYKLGGIGMRNDAKSDFDEYDDFSLPRIGNFIELNHEKTLYGFHYSRDIIPPTPEKIWVFTVESAHSGTTTIEWSSSDVAQLNNELFLVDMETQWPVDMQTHSEYTFQNTGSHSFKIVYGNTEFVKKEVVSDQFRLYGVTPNPTRGKAMVSFAVPDLGYQQPPVSINLISILGQTVARVAPRQYAPGIHQVDLSVSGTNQLYTSPGIYILQVSYGNVQKQTRLLIKP